MASWYYHLGIAATCKILDAGCSLDMVLGMAFMYQPHGRVLSHGHGEDTKHRADGRLYYRTEQRVE